MDPKWRVEVGQVEKHAGHLGGGRESGSLKARIRRIEFSPCAGTRGEF